MTLKYYFDQQKKLYTALIEYINDQDNDETKYQIIIKRFKDQKFGEKYDDTVENLHMLVKVWENHHRTHTFLNKIKRILLNFKSKIKETLPNTKIFKIFQSDKLLLLFIIQNNFITIDESISRMLLNNDIEFNTNYRHFFFPEIQSEISEQKKKEIEQEMKNINPDIFVNFEEKRQIGENDSYICKLIREDSIKDFISYVNRTNTPLSCQIKGSIFETNSFLIQNEPSLIEYAAFFGSIQVFNYLKINGIEINQSSLAYSIHSDNDELINIAIESQDKLSKESSEIILKESIKCHHNNIAYYIIDNNIDPKYFTD